jgi:hypothetical protein
MFATIDWWALVAFGIAFLAIAVLIWFALYVVGHLYMPPKPSEEDRRRWNQRQ